MVIKNKIYKIDMGGMKIVGDYLLAGSWGFSVLSLVAKMNLSSATDIVQLVVAALGIAYMLFVKLPSDYKMNKLKRQRETLEIESINRELDGEGCEDCSCHSKEK